MLDRGIELRSSPRLPLSRRDGLLLSCWPCAFCRMLQVLRSSIEPETHPDGTAGWRHIGYSSGSEGRKGCCLLHGVCGSVLDGRPSFYMKGIGYRQTLPGLHGHSTPLAHVAPLRIKKEGRKIFSSFFEKGVDIYLYLWYNKDVKGERNPDRPAALRERAKGALTMTAQTEYTLWEVSQKIEAKLPYGSLELRRAKDTLQGLEWYLATGRVSGSYELAFRTSTKRQIATIANRIIKLSGADPRQIVDNVGKYLKVDGYSA